MHAPLRHSLGAAIFAATSWTLTGAAHADVGDSVVNIASVSFTVDGFDFNLETNPAIFVIEAPQNEPEIEFFRYSPNAAHSQLTQINGSSFSPSGDISGPFSDIGPARTTGGDVINTSAPLPLIPAQTYLAGELMFVSVTDITANQDPNRIETVVITIAADNGDVITLRLVESGPNTGEFWAYIPTTPSATPLNDNQLTTGSNTLITARYFSTFVSSAVVVDTALVNPSQFVFDSVTGEPIDGAAVTIINADTGEPAEVFGVDGFSRFPSEVVSGDEADDEAGLIYDTESGGFVFPMLPPGNYRIDVQAPEGYNFASSFNPEDIVTSVGGYSLAAGSFGEVFSLDTVSSIRFDIPLDPQTEFVLTKTADRQFGDVGDYVNYTVTVQNAGARSAPVRLFDTLPLGFRYIDQTSRRDQTAIENPQISDDATLLTFPLGVLAPGESVRLDYALQIGPGAPLGDAINRAVVLAPDDSQLSNIARAEVTLREDLLRSTSTIIGRVSERSCDGDEDWAREIVRGVGVEGVRLYMETGGYAVSDADGLFHFEGVSKGTHVVQVDEETLPQGFSAMVCEENTRYAGSATSKFVDVQGGGVWRANFYLKQTGETKDVTTAQELSENQAYKAFDEAWLETVTSEPALVYPNTKDTPATPSVNLGIKHRPDQRVELILNGRPVPKVNLSARDVSKSQLVMISRWRGVDLLEGNNRLVAHIKNADGTIAKTLRESIAYVRNIARATPVPSRSVLIADGRTVPSIAIRLEDEAGRPVHKGRIVTVDIETPYRLYDETGERTIRERQDELLNPLSARQDIQVGRDGIVHVKLEPTLQTGKVTAIITLDTGRKVPVYMYLEPEKRDWILVGLAEGSAAFQRLKGNVSALKGDDDDVITDGRLAFFAKGLVKGDWLMTLAVDTDARRGNRDDDFAGEIDPNAYYTLYGDRSYQEFEGVSRYPVYVKLEKRSAYALFGDYDTNIPEGRLTAYNRRLSGLKAEYIGENFQILGFAAETNQGFAKDELPADGTSGTYQLSNRRILAQSETVTVETRDRNRPDVVLDRKVMVRFLDYTLDYLTGQLIFRTPVDVSDFDFNPNVIVVDYETSEDAERNLTFGGRVQAEFLDDRLRVGSTFVKEDGSALTSGAKSNMIGVDVVGQVSDTTELRAEYAITDTTPGVDNAEAILAEIIHTSEKLQAEAYFRQEDAGFGLGQRNSNTNKVRRYGAKAAYEINEFEDEQSGRRGRNIVEGLAYREENLVTGDTRDSAEVTASHIGDRLSYSAGLRGAKDTLIGRENRESLLAVASASLEVPKHGLTFQAAHEQPLGGKDSVSAFPQRTTLGVDKTLGKKITASLRHEILDGADNRSNNTILGLTSSPWKGGVLTANTDLVTNDLGRRLGATVGLDQNVQISDRWSASAGLRNRNVLSQDGEYIEVAPDAAISPLEQNEDFTSAYIGVGYRDDVMTGSTRLEGRKSVAGDSFIGTAAVARELTEVLSVAGALRGVVNDDKDNATEDTHQFDARVGAAWRPRGEETVIFDRLDFIHARNEQGETQTKIVNNLAMNTLVADNWQLSANYGAKHVRADVAGQKLSNWSHLLGAETRFDVTEKIDLGLRGQVLTSGALGTKEYSFGPSIGVSPVKNVWINGGFNVSGFKDDDFEAAEYSRQGFYLQMRIKFDQHTAAGLLRRISPAASAAEHRAGN
jgi:uncharacterized repeat protein (TIGR01451 family)